MSFGKMNAFIDLVKKEVAVDAEGFKSEKEVTLASVRAYREGRHGSERWANMAALSEATDLFRFRVIPGVSVTTDLALLCDCSASGSFPVYPLPLTWRSSAMATALRSPRWRM